MSNENKNNEMEVQEFTPAEEVRQEVRQEEGNTSIALVSEENFALIFNGKVDEKIALVEKELKAILRKEVSDKKAYQDMKDLKNKVIVKMRTATVAKSKEMTEGYKKAISDIKGVENSIIDRVTKRLESKADERIEAYENYVKELEQKAEREAQERYDSRMTELKSNGLKFDGEMYSIRDVSIDAMYVKGIDDEKYNSLLEKVKVANALNIKEEEERQAEAERQRVADELEKQKVEEARLENERIQNQLKEQQQALQKQMDDFNRMKKEEEEKIQAEKDRIERERKQKEADEAKAELEKQQEAERLTEQKRIEEENKIIVERTTPLNGLLAYNFNTESWSRKVGGESFVLFRKDVLSDDFNPKEYAEKVQLAITKHELKLEQERQSMLNDTQKVTEYISKLQEVQVPLLENSELNARLKQLVKTIGEFK